MNCILCELDHQQKLICMFVEMQEGLCSDAASFDLPSWLLTACISESKNCVDLSISRREIEKANDKSCNPDNFAILRGKSN